MIQRMMTAEEFAEQRVELPDGGQWAELVRGVPVTLQTPDIDHGTIVLNLSKALSTYVHAGNSGYPCFDLGIQVETRPDTIFFPAISYFLKGERFAETDKAFTNAVPELIVELITTTDRRMNINERSRCYIDKGSKVVWVIDSSQRTVHIIEKGNPVAKHVKESELLVGKPALDTFEIPVSDLFIEPDWVQ